MTVEQVRTEDIADVSAHVRTREGLFGRGTIVISPKHSGGVLKLYECREPEAVAESLREIVEAKRE